MENSLWHFLLNSGPVVKVVMLILLALSVFSWMFIFQRYQVLRDTKKTFADFQKRFWNCSDLTKLYSRLVQNDTDSSGPARVFQAGFDEFLKLRERRGIATEAMLQRVQTAMQVAQSKELLRVENHLGFLATVGSTTPYIGLFGTVWGIMTSFQALGSVQQATIAMVAPGIAEALIATAMGLFAAIPAVIAYNRYRQQVDSLAIQFENFQDEFANILYRELHAPSGSEAQQSH